MTLSRLALAALGLLGFASAASAQQVATTVQLPTFSFTTVNTTVMVPDQGSAFLGGVNRSSEGRVERGVPLLGSVPFLNRPFRNNAIGSNTSALQMRTVATIINLDELDEAVLAEAASRRLARGETVGGARLAGGGFGGAAFGGRSTEDSAIERRADFLAHNVGRSTEDVARAEPPRKTAPSPEEIKRKNEAAQEARDAEAVAYFDKAESAIADGKAGVAKIYYGMAAKRATGDFKSQVAERLEALNAGGR
jgi:hypothetical protein